MIKLDKKEEKIILIVIIVLLSITAAYRIIVFKSDSVTLIQDGEGKGLLKEGEQEEVQERAPEKIYVYITGEVNTPGLYTMVPGDRIGDAINKAGGFTGEADITSINMAEKVRDEQFINISKKLPQGTALNPEIPVKSPIVGGKINVNTATAEELDDFLPGIGPTYAKNIVDYRNKNGSFKSINDLTKVKGIGDKKRFENIKDLVTVN